MCEKMMQFYDADPDYVSESRIDIPLELNKHNDGSEPTMLVTSQDLYFKHPEVSLFDYLGR